MHTDTETHPTCEKFDDADSDLVFDLHSFPAFRPLLEACQEYAKITGSRFLKGTLNDLQSNANNREATAKLRESADLVNKFRLRLLERDPDLMPSLKFAYQRVMTESVRNGIVGTCKQLNLWPPKPCPANVLDDDCAWQDMSALLPEIAQRVFNEDSKRGQNQELTPLQLQATTASFIVDFATDVGAASELSSPDDMHKEQLAEFQLRVDEWVQYSATSADPVPLADLARKALLKGLGPGSVADNMRRQVQVTWTENWETPGGTIANVAIIGLGMVAFAAAIHRGAKRRR
jgi:hypothetical protein